MNTSEEEEREKGKLTTTCVVQVQVHTKINSKSNKLTSWFIR